MQGTLQATQQETKKEFAPKYCTDLCKRETRDHAKGNPESQKYAVQTKHVKQDASVMHNLTDLNPSARDQCNASVQIAHLISLLPVELGAARTQRRVKVVEILHRQ
eukprot:349737-Pleurochrysis_carterae.AAC.2